MLRTLVAAVVLASVGTLNAQTPASTQPAARPASPAPGLASEPTARLDVSNFCCPDYILALRRSVAASWDSSPGVAGTVTVRFIVERTGQVSKPEIERSSGFAVLDLNAMRAVRAAKLPPLPAAFDQPTLTVHLAFATATSSPPSPANGRQASPGNLGDALRNLQRYVQTKNDFPPISNTAGSASPGASIEFDSQGVEFGPWLRRFIAHVRRNWMIPQAAMTMKGRSVVRFTVSKAGVISNATVTQPSGIAQFDRAALNAIVASNPLEPLPREYPRDEVVFTVNFYYNEQPPKQ